MHMKEKEELTCKRAGMEVDEQPCVDNDGDVKVVSGGQASRFVVPLHPAIAMILRWVGSCGHTSGGHMESRILALPCLNYLVLPFLQHSCRWFVVGSQGMHAVLDDAISGALVILGHVSSPWHTIST